MTLLGDIFKLHKMRHSALLLAVTRCHMQIICMCKQNYYYSELLAKQYWLSCYQSHHPCHHLSSLPAPARNMKGTLMKFNNEVVPLSEEASQTEMQIFTGTAYAPFTANCLRTLHSQAVIDARANFVPESLELHHLISHLLKVCSLGQSAPHLPSCVPVTVSS